MTRPTTYSDLLDRIAKDQNLGGELVLAARLTVEWLDEHPEQLPNASITEKKYRELRNTFIERGIVTSMPGFLELITDGLGLTVTRPPSNKTLLMRTLSSTPGLNLSYNQKINIASVLDARGVRAPEAEDD